MPTNRRNFALAAALVLVAAACGRQSTAPPVADAPAADASAVAAEPTPSAATATVETIELGPENTEITFVGTKVTGGHDGGFHQHSGLLHLDPTAPEKSHLRIEIDTPSVWTDTERLTGHLKTDDFFAVEQFPRAIFESTSIAPARGPDATHEVRGTLELRGVSREIAMPLAVDLTTDRLTAEGSFEINRQEFDIKYPGAPDNLISDTVVVTVKVDAARTKTQTEEAATPPAVL